MDDRRDRPGAGHHLARSGQRADRQHPHLGGQGGNVERGRRHGDREALLGPGRGRGAVADAGRSPRRVEWRVVPRRRPTDRGHLHGARGAVGRRRQHGRQRAGDLQRRYQRTDFRARSGGGVPHGRARARGKRAGRLRVVVQDLGEAHRPGDEGAPARAALAGKARLGGRSHLHAGEQDGAAPGGGVRRRDTAPPARRQGGAQRRVLPEGDARLQDLPGRAHRAPAPADRAQPLGRAAAHRGPRPSTARGLLGVLHPHGEPRAQPA